MALPLLFSLNRLQRAALPMIRGGVAKGLSTRTINSIISRALGSGIQRPVLLAIIRSEKNIAASGTQLKFLRKNSFPNTQLLPESTVARLRKLNYVVEVRGVRIDTGEKFIQHITVATDVNLTRGEIEATADTFVVQGEERYLLVVESLLLISGERAGAAGVF